MTPESMTDEQLAGPREIVSCVLVGDTWEVTLSCGHEATFVTLQPMMVLACAQCLEILLERRRKP